MPLWDAKEIDAIREGQTKRNEQGKNSHEAAKFIVSQVKKYPKEVVIIALGGLSNIATAIKQDSKFAANVKVRPFCLSLKLLLRFNRSSYILIVVENCIYGYGPQTERKTNRFIYFQRSD
jgi:hypothetical protein